MLHRRVVILAALLVLLVAAPAPITAQGSLPDFPARTHADMVLGDVEARAVDIGVGPMGSAEEAAAADYIAAAFEDWGYAVEIQAFETVAPAEEEDAEGEPVTSRNVIATLAGDDEMIVVGAHMDSVTDGTGAGDNASGVAAMLAAAEALADLDTVHTLVFVAFGAEEGGNPSGADMYVESLGEDIGSVIAMLNLDSVGVGTNLNVYAGAEITWPDDEDAAPEIVGGPTWVRDLALDLAAEMNLPLGTTPDETWGGFTGDWSDHYAFVLEGVPVAYFEAWLWEGGENPWWGQETEAGDVMHTPGDVYENVAPEKVEMAAEVVAATAAALALGLAGPE
jgi:acetylornithine deacetylase/succinyl-diaminopimelate desuccinylase-like protein